jgi:hypothetical protein
MPVHNARAPSGLARRPQWVRCFAVDVLVRPRESSRPERPERQTTRSPPRGARKRSRTWSRWPRRRSRTRTGCTCPGVPRRHGRDARPRCRHARQLAPRGRQPSSDGVPTSSRANADARGPASTRSGTACRLRPRPGWAAAQTAGPAARCELFSRLEAYHGDSRRAGQCPSLQKQ